MEIWYYSIDSRRHIRGCFQVLSDGEEKNEYDTGSIGLPILFVYYLS